MSKSLDIYLFSKPQWMRSVYLVCTVNILQKHFIVDYTVISISFNLVTRVLLYGLDACKICINRRLIVINIDKSWHLSNL